MEREKLEKKVESSERNSSDGRRDAAAAAALLPLASTVSEEGKTNNDRTTGSPPENQQLRRQIISTAFKNLDQQTVVDKKGSAAMPENQQVRREIERGQKEAAELPLLSRRDSAARGDIISAEAEFKIFYPQTLDDPTEFDPRILDEFPYLGLYSDQENLGGGTVASDLPPPPLQNQNTVSSLLKLQVGLFGLGRVLENQIINNANASTSENAPSRLITETALALLKCPTTYCIGGCSSVEVKNSTTMEEWKEAFEQCYNEECSRVDKVTTAYNNRIMRRIPKLDALHERYVTILVSVRGEHELPFINNWGDMETAVKKLASIPSDSVNDAKVLWSPEDEDGTLSDKELLDSYPLIRPFNNVLRRFLMCCGASKTKTEPSRIKELLDSYPSIKPFDNVLRRWL